MEDEIGRLSAPCNGTGLADLFPSSEIDGQDLFESGTMRIMLTTSEHARHARAELDAIAAALRLSELAQLVVLGRRLLDLDSAREDEQGGEGSSLDDRR